MWISSDCSKSARDHGWMTAVNICPCILSIACFSNYRPPSESEQCWSEIHLNLIKWKIMCSLPFLELTPEAEWIINNGERSFSTAENSIKMSCYARHFLLILNEHSVEQIFRLVWERDLSVLLILSLLLTPRKSRNCQTKYSVMGLRKGNSIKIMYENSFIKSYLKAVNIF